MKDVREILNELNEGNMELAKQRPEVLSAFSAFMKANGADSALNAKTKELISVAIAVFSRCEYCIVYHVYRAYAEGAAKEEIIDAALVAMGFGAGPAMAYTSTLLMNSVNEFEKDFKK